MCVLCVQADVLAAIPTLLDSILGALICCVLNSPARAHLFMAANHAVKACGNVENGSKLIRYVLLSLREFCQPGRAVGDSSCVQERIAVAECVQAWCIPELVETHELPLWKAACTSCAMLGKYDKSDAVRRACVATAAHITATLGPDAASSIGAPKRPPTSDSRPVTPLRRAPGGDMTEIASSTTPSVPVAAAPVATVEDVANEIAAKTITDVPPQASITKRVATTLSTATLDVPLDISTFLLDAVIQTHQTYRIGLHKGLGSFLGSALRTVNPEQLPKLKPSTLPGMVMRLCVDVLTPTLTCCKDYQQDWTVALTWFQAAATFPKTRDIVEKFREKVAETVSATSAQAGDDATAMFPDILLSWVQRDSEGSSS
jgi:hypothetical protein